MVTQAGYLVPPTQFMLEIIKELDNEVLIRGLSRKISLNKAVSLGRPRRTARISTWAWGGEIATPTEDSTLAYGERNLEPH